MLKKYRAVIILASLIVIIFVSGIFIVHQANAPLRQAKKEATVIAKKYAGIEEVSEFYWYNRQKTYFTVAGNNSKNQPVYVIIPKKGGNVTVIKQSAGLTEDQATNLVWKNYAVKKIMNVALGYTKKKPIWEISYLTEKGKLNYVTYDFATGEQISTINNL